MAYFNNKTIKGQVYDLAHLEPFTFDIDIDGSVFVVHVTFSCHCFTVEFGPEHTPDLRYRHKDEVRAFSVERHDLSLKLPEMIRTLGFRSVYYSEQGNFFVLRDQELAGGKLPYLIFFSTFQANDRKIHVRMLIRSAYLKPNMSRWGAPVKFSTLVKFTAEGRQPRLGPKVQVKRK